MSVLEAGFFTNCLDQAMSGPADPFILNRSELATGIDIPLEQHRAYWLAFGFNSFTRQSNIAATFLRFQAQAERLHRRAVEDFHRLFKLRGQLPPEKYEEPNEPTIEPARALQPTENTAPPSAPSIPQPENEPNAEPSPAPVPKETARAGSRLEDNPRPVPVPENSQRAPPSRATGMSPKSRTDSKMTIGRR
jgi:hypothetical protein